MHFDRRRFIKQSGAALALAGVGNVIYDLILPRGARADTAHTFAGPLPLGTPIVVMIDLAGGNDALNTHVPYAVPGVTGYYLQDRPNMAIKSVITQWPFAPPPAGNSLPPALDLDGKYGLHGSLVWLANRWHQRGDVAIVEGVGEDVVKDFSHFASAAYRAAAAFTGPRLSSGWLGRYNDLWNLGQPLASVSLGGMHPSLAGQATAVMSVSDVVGFDWPLPPRIVDATRYLTDLKLVRESTFPPSLNKAFVAAASMRRTTDAIAALKAAAKPTLDVGVPTGSLVYRLVQAAMMITGDMPCQTYVTTHPGFDTHGAQPYNHGVVLRDLDMALDYFFGIIEQSPRKNDVFVLITSEFGRQVKENASLGCDHGRGGLAMLVGGGVQGGLYGQAPSLAVRDHDALIPTVDFRSVCSTVVRRLGGSSSVTQAVMGKDESLNDFPNLGIFG